MENSNLIGAWKKNERTSEGMKPNINRELLHRINGGGASAGNICSLSAECNSSGASCAAGWNLLEDVARRFNDWYFGVVN